jgi:ACS family tartrate transporter-like MFS transporter
MFALGIPLSSVIGSPVSGAIMQWMDGVLGVKGWQWLYILEALPAVLLGFAVLVLFANRPAEARWLSPQQRTWLAAEFAREEPGPAESHSGFTWSMLADTRVLALGGVFFLTAVPSYGLSLWLPQIVKSFGVSHIATGLLTAAPFAFGCVAMLYWGRRSDARQERLWHAVIPAVLAGVALLGGAMLSSGPLQLLAVCLAAAGIYALKGPFLTMVSESFADRRAAVGIALVTTLGNLSGFVAPYMIGLIMQGTDSYRIALAALGVQSALGALLLFAWVVGRRPALQEQVA